ncbi:hypothetical protein V8D89_009441 [Ganoderma adspersum]
MHTNFKPPTLPPPSHRHYLRRPRRPHPSSHPPQPRRTHEASFSACAHLGDTLDLGYDSGQRALCENDLSALFVQHSLPEADTSRFEDSQKDPRDLCPEIDRSVLRKIMLDALPATDIKRGQTLASVCALSGGTHELMFANGHTAMCDILIGADGAYSRVCPLVSSAVPLYHGVTGVKISLAPNPRHMSQMSPIPMPPFHGLRRDAPYGWITNIPANVVIHKERAIKMYLLNSRDLDDVPFNDRLIKQPNRSYYCNEYKERDVEWKAWQIHGGPIGYWEFLKRRLRAGRRFPCTLFPYSYRRGFRYDLRLTTPPELQDRHVCDSIILRDMKLALPMIWNACNVILDHVFLSGHIPLSAKDLTSDRENTMKLAVPIFRA